MPKEVTILLPLNIAICEDDPNDTHTLREMIARSGVSASVFVYENTEDLLSAFQPGLFQLALLDIYFGGSPDLNVRRESAANLGAAEFPQGGSADRGCQIPNGVPAESEIPWGAKPDGLDAAVRVREADPDIWIAFTTSSLVHAKFGYKVKADRYIDKPLDEQEVLSLLERAAKHFAETSAEITVTVDYKKRAIRQRDIRYVEIFNKKSAIHLADETVTTYINISEMEELLTLPSFLRCHRCNIVNMDYIDGGAEDEQDFIMENGDRVYIGRNDRYKAKRAYREYIARLARGQPTTAACGG